MTLQKKGVLSPHLICFDTSCPLCLRMVCFLIRKDSKKKFCFTSLNSPDFKKFIPDMHSVVLVTDFKKTPKTFLQAKALFSIAWLLGSYWKILGLLSFLPCALFNWLYRLTANHRMKISSHFKEPDIETTQELKKRMIL